MSQTATAPAPAATIPLIDISGLRGGPEQKRRVARDLHAACIGTGFFYVRGHGVPDDLVTRVFQASRAFFALPMEDRLAVSQTKSACYRGYELLRGQALEPGMPPDVKEGFKLGRDLPADHPAALDDPKHYGPNQWPARLPAFKLAMEVYLSAMTEITTLMMEGIALSLGLDERYFAPFCDTPVTLVRLLHYPPQPPNPLPGEKGCGAHTDFGAITLLAQDDAGGLQVQSADGDWIDAAPLPGTFVVNLGDMLARWTNDRYRSTPHRVINLSGRDRYSVAFFMDGNSNHRVTCIPTCRAPDEADHYPPTTVREHLEDMYRRSRPPTVAV